MSLKILHAMQTHYPNVIGLSQLSAREPGFAKGFSKFRDGAVI
jgi:hypothetical protein